MYLLIITLNLVVRTSTPTEDILVGSKDTVSHHGATKPTHMRIESMYVCICLYTCCDATRGRTCKKQHISNMMNMLFH